MRITYKDLVAKHGEAKAQQIGQAICDIHGGIGFFDFKSHRGGIDTSGVSEAGQKKIENLLAPEPAEPKKKEGDK